MFSGIGSETCLERKFVSLKKKNCALQGRYIEIQLKDVITHGLVNLKQEMKYPKLNWMDIYFQQ